MDKQLKNLFPEAISKGASEIFGDQSMQPVLLGLLSATTVAEHPQADSRFCEMLHPKEAAILSGYRFPKRRSEYLTGRICAKMAIQGFSNLTETHAIPLLLPEIEIANTVNGRPNVRVHTPKANALKMDISISHSGNYGVALAAESKCGIDLQRQEAALRRVQEKYCSEGEYRLLETFLTDNDAVTRLAIVWAAKEAAKKALSHWQMPGFLDLEVRELKSFTHCMALSLRLTHTKSQQIPEELTVVAGMFDDYALAICLVNEDRSDAGTTRS
jgi:phosphopantetheinyl transferase